jgi:hypothetical protein
MNRNPWLKLVIYGLHAVQWSFAVMPLLYWLSVVALAFHASSVLGHWPRPGYDDPKGIPAIEVHFEFCYMLLTFSMTGFFAVLLLIPLLKYVDPETAPAKRYITLFAAWLLMIILTNADPAHIFLWFFD